MFSVKKHQDRQGGHMRSIQPESPQVNESRVRLFKRFQAPLVILLVLCLLIFVGYRYYQEASQPLASLKTEQIPLSSSQRSSLQLSAKSNQNQKTISEHVTPYITLRATPRASEALVTLKTLIKESVFHVEKRLGLPLTQSIQITVSENPKSMRALAQAEQGWSPPEWSNGLAYPKVRAIYLHQDHLAGLERTLRHELAHLALAELHTLPLWMNEGLAVWASESVSFERMKTLTQARLTGDIIPISSLKRSFPSSPSRAQLAYAQSAHLITYLADHHGEDHLRASLKTLSNQASLDTTFRKHFGLSLGELEGQWRAQLTHGRLEGLSSLAQEGVPMALGLILTIFIALVFALRGAIQTQWGRTHLPQERQREGLLGVRVQARSSVDHPSQSDS